MFNFCLLLKCKVKIVLKVLSTKTRVLSFESEFPLWLVSHSPVELRLQVTLEDLLNWHVLDFAPADCNSRVHVVDSARAKCHRFVILTSLQLDLFFLNGSLQLRNLSLASVGVLGSALLSSHVLKIALELFPCLKRFAELFKFLQFVLLIHDSLALFLDSLLGSLAHSLLMVAKDGNFSVAVFIELDFSLNGVLISVNLALFQLLLKSKRCVVGTEYFS